MKKKFILIQILFLVVGVISLQLRANAQTQITNPSEQEKLCPPIMCVWDPCPGKHLPDANGCVNCASPCAEGTETSPPSSVCIQVITPAVSPEGICKNFPTPCDVPAGWKKVEKCPGEVVPPINEGEIKPSPVSPPIKELPLPAETLPPENQTKPVSPKYPGTETKALPGLLSVNVCAVSDDYLKEINNLIKEADLAKSSGDFEKEKIITEKIKLIKEKIEARKEECQNASQAPPSLTQPPQQQNVVTGQNIVKEDFCQLENEIAAKIEYYKGLLSLSPEELNNKGYEKEEVGKILGELQNEKARVHSACSGQKVGWTISEIKPVAPQKAEEVANYYKEKVAQTIEGTASLSVQMAEIKEIKKETAKMVKELIRSQQEISAIEIQPLVDKLVVKPGVIETSQDQIKVSEQKKVEAQVSNKPVEILVNPQKLIIKERRWEGKQVEIETQLPLNLSVQGTIIGDPGVQGGIIGDTGLESGKEIKVSPSEIVEKAKIKNPIDLKVELVKEREIPVYKVKAVEKRKLLSLIPVKVSKEITIDATTEQGTKLSEKKPWWSFLTF